MFYCLILDSSAAGGTIGGRHVRARSKPGRKPEPDWSVPDRSQPGGPAPVGDRRREPEAEARACVRGPFSYTVRRARIATTDVTASVFAAAVTDVRELCCFCFFHFPLVQLLVSGQVSGPLGGPNLS